MPHAIIIANYGPSEAEQTIKTDTLEQTAEKFEALRANDHCQSIDVFVINESVVRQSTWVPK